METIDPFIRNSLVETKSQRRLLLFMLLNPTRHKLLILSEFLYLTVERVGIVARNSYSESEKVVVEVEVARVWSRIDTSNSVSGHCDLRQGCQF